MKTHRAVADAADGDSVRVFFSRDGSEANFVQVLHDDGTTAVYAHLQLDTVRVRPGQQVVRGEFIANSGNTGFSTGPHLHWGMKWGSARIDPLLIAGSMPVTAD